MLTSACVPGQRCGDAEGLAQERWDGSVRPEFIARFRGWTGRSVQPVKSVRFIGKITSFPVSRQLPQHGQVPVAGPAHCANVVNLVLDAGP